jgi:hypothetical protein
MYNEYCKTGTSAALQKASVDEISFSHDFKTIKTYMKLHVPEIDPLPNRE